MDAVHLSTSTTARWRALAPPLPLRTGAASVAWLGTMFVAVMSERSYVCTPAEPCGGDWVAPVAFNLLVLAIVGMLVDPRSGALAGAVLAPFGLYYDATPGARVLVPAVFFVSALLCVAAVVADARSRRERLALLDDAARGQRVPLPDEVLDRPLRTARLLTAGAGVSLLVAAALAGWVAQRASSQHAAERRAPVVEATVAAYDESDSVAVFVAGGLRDEVEVYGTYAVGDVVAVWDLGGSLRPVGEPYDASFPGVLPGLAVVAAILLARRAALVRAEVRALRLGGPAFRVKVGPAPGGGIAVLDRHKPMLVPAVRTGEVRDLLWPDDPPEPGSFLPLPEDDLDEELRPRVVTVVGRLVPRGLVAIHARDRWVAPYELARVPHKPR